MPIIEYFKQMCGVRMRLQCINLLFFVVLNIKTIFIHMLKCGI